MNLSNRLACAAVACAISLGAWGLDPPAYLSRHRASADDRIAIEALLRAYTTCVTNGDRASFESLLLDEDVPFSSTSALTGIGQSAQPVTTRNYSQFRSAIFDSGVHYRQRFYNVRIEQDGTLAQVSLDFVTEEAQSKRGGYGWKTLQLLKIDGHWKIASEFFTARALPEPS